MKIKLSLLTIGALLFLGNICHAQSAFSVDVDKIDGTSNTIWMTHSGEVLFIGNQILVKENASTADYTTFNIDEVANLHFNYSIESIDNPQETNPITLYPNPAQGTVAIQGIGSKAEMVSVFSITGVKMMEQLCHDGDLVNISHLSNGLYFVHIGSHTVKLSKL